MFRVQQTEFRKASELEQNRLDMITDNKRDRNRTRSQFIGASKIQVRRPPSGVATTCSRDLCLCLRLGWVRRVGYIPQEDMDELETKIVIKARLVNSLTTLLEQKRTEWAERSKGMATRAAAQVRPVAWPCFFHALPQSFTLAALCTPHTDTARVPDGAQAGEGGDPEHEDEAEQRVRQAAHARSRRQVRVARARCTAARAHHPKSALTRTWS